MRKNKLLLLLALLMTAATGAWAQTTYTIKFEANGNSKTVENVTLPHTFSCDYSGENGELDQIIKQLYGLSGGCCAMNSPGASGNSNVTAGMNGDNQFITISAPFEGNATVTGSYFDAAMGYSDFDYSLTISCPGYTPAGYTVSLKDGVKDADKWTVKVGEGQAQALPIGGLKGDGSETVTLQYTGRLKVKGVKATSDAAAEQAKEPATVTTAPTGAAIVGVGKETALVSGGVAEGGTMMYKVTTDNTKPASTDGFSDAVPTAQGITASGKVYVWYYVKGDDTHSDSEIAATAIEVPVADVVWDATNVSTLSIQGTHWPYEKEGITLSCNADQAEAVWADYGDPATVGIIFGVGESGGFTFTAPTGKAFKKIVMKAQSSAGWGEVNLGDGWTFVGDDTNNIYTVTWKDSAASTVGLLTDTDDFSGAAPVKSIGFYLVDAE